ncbi:MAG: peptidoglycan-binding protein [Hyphomicrobiaceae bacterium]|nr:peptidoglycan-binding protein [Hyphomicrobiaceae bacterium]
MRYTSQKPTFDRILRRGDKGDDVKQLQNILNDLGYELKVDGEYGCGTKEACDFQKKELVSAPTVTSGPARSLRLRVVEDLKPVLLTSGLRINSRFPFVVVIRMDWFWHEQVVCRDRCDV